MLRNGDWNDQTTTPCNKPQDDDFVMSLIQVTLSKPKEEREQYLRSACAQDSELFKEVWKYLEAEEGMNRFLPDPPYSARSSEVVFKPSQLLDNRFRIVREV